MKHLFDLTASGYSYPTCVIVDCNQCSIALLLFLSIEILRNVNSGSVSFHMELLAIMLKPERFVMLSFI